MATGSYIALLRGINVGGRNRLPMRDLITIFRDAGAADVRSYIQSGNVVFRAPNALARRLPTQVSDAIASRCGFRPPVVMRTRAELERVVDGNPFLSSDVDEKLLAVGFLVDRPSAARVERLDADRSPPDRFAVVGREIYLCCPNGMARTRLTNPYFDKQLETVSTMRNWRTTLKLLELADD